MDAFGDSVAFRKAPHADNWLKPLSDGAPQLLEYLRSLHEASSGEACHEVRSVVEWLVPDILQDL